MIMSNGLATEQSLENALTSCTGLLPALPRSTTFAASRAIIAARAIILTDSEFTRTL